MHSAVETRNMCLNSLFITVHLLKTALLQCSITHMSITPMSGHTHPAITLFLCNSEANPQCRKLTHTHEKPGARSSDRQQYFTLLSQPRFLPETLRWPSCLRVSVFFVCVVLSLSFTLWFSLSGFSAASSFGFSSSAPPPCAAERFFLCAPTRWLKAKSTHCYLGAAQDWRSVCVSVCVREQERESERESLCVCVCQRVFVSGFRLIGLVSLSLTHSSSKKMSIKMSKES